MLSRSVLIGAVLVAVVGALILLTDEKGEHESSEGGWIGSVAGKRAEVWAVGDADPPKAGRVARLIRRADPDRILYVGDVYETGTAAEFERWAEPWAGLLDRMAPTPGNHEWRNADEGYRPFWRRVTGREPPDSYSFRAGSWQILSINSQLFTPRGTRRWLRKRVQSGGNCRIVFWHRPRFNAGRHRPGAGGVVKRYWDTVVGGARIVITGHDHDYQRMKARDGVIQFISGSGGKRLHSVDDGDDRLAFSDDEHYGALRLRLSPERAGWRFVASNGDVLDSGSTRCQA